MADHMTMVPVREVVAHQPDLKTLRFEAPFDAAPGQFVFLWLPGVGEKPLSISELRDGVMDLSIKAIGPWTRACMEVEPGQHLGLRGPFGAGFTVRERALLVGGGIGIAPIRFLAHHMARHGLAPRLLLGARTATDLFFTEELAALGARFCTEDGSIGAQGLVTALIEQALAEAPAVEIHACGPEPMLVAVRDLASRRGLGVQLAMERMMKCGLGICGQCCLDGSGIRLCVEGPVLDDAQLADITDFGLPHRDATGAR